MRIGAALSKYQNRIFIKNFGRQTQTFNQQPKGMGPMAKTLGFKLQFFDMPGPKCRQAIPQSVLMGAGQLGQGIQLHITELFDSREG